MRIFLCTLLIFNALDVGAYAMFLGRQRYPRLSTGTRRSDVLNMAMALLWMFWSVYFLAK